MRLPLLILHITGGTLGIIAGFAAMFLRKGSDRHRVAGNVFVVSMLTMAAAAVCLAFMKQQANNVFGGLFTIYLISTAWLAGSSRTVTRRLGVFDWAGFLFALLMGVFTMMHGIEKASGTAHSNDGVPFGMDLFMGCVILLAAAGDLRMIMRGGVFGIQRIARHLWRMCFGLFIASGSFFLGQGAKVFPGWLVKSNVLIVPALLPLALLIFWLFRVRFGNRYQTRTVPGASGAFSLPS
ncbi:MAG TPA: hypothetical protein VLW06_14105 [Terriglobales bacterium]|nr:hypothetical protein [Terriglobales bacterium]